MDVTAITRHVRLAPSKARAIVAKLKGLPVSEALKITDLTKRKAGFYIGKTLRSAIANAEHNASLNVDDLLVKKAVIEEGARWKRYWSRSRGSVSHISKRTCHVRIELTDGSGEKKV